MARGINKVIIIGNLGKDPEVKYMPNGNAVANVTIATSESWKDKNTSERLSVQNGLMLLHLTSLLRYVASILKEDKRSIFQEN